MKQITILDGGMGRELKRIGAPFSQPLWSAQALIESPEHVKQVHQAFIHAGAEIISVNSYACVPFHLGQSLYTNQGPQLAQQAAALARQAVTESQQSVLVAGVLPPPFGSYRPDLFDAEQAEKIWNQLYDAQKEHVDLWLVETVASITEAKVAAKVLANTDKPWYIAYTLQDELSAPAKLRSGELVSDAVKAQLNNNALTSHTLNNNALKKHANGVLFNCSVPEVMAQAIQETSNMLSAAGMTLDIGVYANSFTPINSSHKANDCFQELRDVNEAEYLDFAKTWHKLGANIIGGCCGISPSHIETLSRWRDRESKLTQR